MSEHVQVFPFIVINLIPSHHMFFISPSHTHNPNVIVALIKFHQHSPTARRRKREREGKSLRSASHFNKIKRNAEKLFFFFVSPHSNSFSSATPLSLFHQQTDDYDCLRRKEFFSLLISPHFSIPLQVRFPLSFSVIELFPLGFGFLCLFDFSIMSLCCREWKEHTFSEMGEKKGILIRWHFIALFLEEKGNFSSFWFSESDFKAIWGEILGENWILFVDFWINCDFKFLKQTKIRYVQFEEILMDAPWGIANSLDL